MIEKTEGAEAIKEEVKSVEKTKTFKADFIADIYAFFHFKSSTGEKVGSLEVNSKAGAYNLAGKNFNWDDFEKVFKEIITSEMVKDLVENPQPLRIPVGEQFADQKNYYKIESLEKKGE